MNKALLAVAATAGLVASSDATRRDQTIIVVAPPMTLLLWSQKVINSVESDLLYPRFPVGEEEYGIVSVTFCCSDNGKSSNVTPEENSGSWALDRMALSAVRHIKTLHSMPLSFKSGQTFRANILFAGDDADRKRQLRSMNADATRWNASHDTGAQPITLDIGSHPQTGS